MDIVFKNQFLCSFAGKWKQTLLPRVFQENQAPITNWHVMNNTASVCFPHLTSYSQIGNSCNPYEVKYFKKNSYI